MSVVTFPNPKIATRGATGESNGFLVPIFSVHDEKIAPAQHPQQVYLTVVAPGCVKGPHLHMKRWGLFTCIKGNVRIVLKMSHGYDEYVSGEAHEFRTVQVPAGVGTALQNIGSEDAYVLNMPSPAWNAIDQDEHFIHFQDYEFRWR